MKRIASILLFFSAFILGCETEPRLFTGPYHVRFTEPSFTTKESYTPTISIQVHLVSPALEEDVTIFYDIAGSARENIDYEILETRGSVTIEKGEYFGVIEVKLINNANNILRSQELLLTLNSATGGDLQVGQNEGGIGKTFALTIVDDCILGGSYLGKRGSTSTPVTITSQDCEKYILSNWNINVFASSTPMDLTFIDNGDNTLTIPEQEEENIDEEFATIKGDGVVDPVTGAIIMNITLEDIEDQPTVTLNLTRN
jgi:hypothetical protein